MKEILETTEIIERDAKINVKDFDFTKLCYKNIFELMNNSGVFKKAFNELTTLNIVSKEQVVLTTFNYGFVEESDEKVYPMVDLILNVSDNECEFETYFCLSVTPFNAYLHNGSKDAGVYGGCDREISKIWRKVMKAFFKESYVEAFRQYCIDARVIRDCEIEARAHKELEHNEKFYNEEINSI